MNKDEKIKYILHYAKIVKSDKVEKELIGLSDSAIDEVFKDTIDCAFKVCEKVFELIHNEGVN